MKHTQSEKLYKRGEKTLVGAVNSPVRAFKSVGGTPLFIEKAEGAYIYDVDGNAYIDLVQSYGPMILGHRNANVLQAVQTALTEGFSFGASTLKEIELAELICDAFDGMDKIRFVNSGTEAIMSAIRLARAVTKKSKIIKFSGCYHGHSDSLLVAAGSGVETLSIPSSVGVPQEAVNNTLIAQYNNIQSVKDLIAKHQDIAAVFIEPIAGNMGVVVPNDSFLKELRKITQENNILLVVDEVMTGFRSGFGGAQKSLGIQADITCLGKVIGGGFPIGAYGASQEIMDNVAPLGNVYQAGTLSGNPIGMTAGLATLQELKAQNPYEKFEKQAEKIENILYSEAEKNNIDIQVNRYGAMISPFFTSTKVVDFETAKTSNQNLFTQFFWNMLENGIYIPPSAFEAWFLSTVLGEKEMNQLENAIAKSLNDIKQ